MPLEIPDPTYDNKTRKKIIELQIPYKILIFNFLLPVLIDFNTRKITANPYNSSKYCAKVGAHGYQDFLVYQIGQVVALLSGSFDFMFDFNTTLWYIYRL